MTAKRPRRPRDPNQLAHTIIGIATGAIVEGDLTPEPDPNKNQAAVELGRLGGKKGGKARAASLTAEQRTQIARKAAQKRWEKSR